jgi:hypothetical protein
MARVYCLALASTHLSLWLLPAVVGEMSKFEKWSLIWAMATAIATCIAAVMVIAGGIYGYVQLKEVIRAGQLESALAFLRLIDSAEFRNARRLVYSPNACTKLAEAVRDGPQGEVLSQRLEGLSGNTVNLDKFHSYLSSLEHLSILVMNDLAPDPIVRVYFGRMAPHHWRTLQPFIRFMRDYYHSDDFLQHFEMLNCVLLEPDIGTDRVPVQKKRDILKRWRLAREHTEDYQIALLPDAESEAALIKLSLAIHNAVGSRKVLDKRRSRPHVTLYLATFPTESLVAIKEELSKVCGRYFSFTLSVTKPVQKHEGLVMLECSGLESLRALHCEVVEKLNPLRRGAVRSGIWDESVPKLSPQQVDMLNKVGYPYAQDLWLPHFTIADVAPNDIEKALRLVNGVKIEVSFQGLSVGLSDSQGRFRKYLGTCPLKQRAVQT